MNTMLKAWDYHQLDASGAPYEKHPPKANYRDSESGHTVA